MRDGYCFFPLSSRIMILRYMQKHMRSSLILLKSSLVKTHVFRFCHSVGSQTNMKISPSPLSPPINGGELKESPLPWRPMAPGPRLLKERARGGGGALGNDRYGAFLM